MKNVLLVTLVAIAAGLFASWHFAGWVAKYTSPKFEFNDMPNLAGKVAIVTGANTGIGKVTARELARKGAHVIVAARTESKGIAAVRDIQQAVSGAHVEYMNLDLSSMVNVKQFADNVVAKNIGIDILILNAGIMMSPFQLTKDNVESQFGTNHLGHFVLVQNLMPVLMQSKARIVHVSSMAHTFALNGIDFTTINVEKAYDRINAYSISKLSNVLYSNELARRYAATGVTSYAIHPGLVRSDLMRHVDSGMVDGWEAGGFIAKAYTIVKDAAFEAMALTTDDGALTQLYVATMPNLENLSGTYWNPVGVLGTPSAHASNPKLSKELWDYSMELARDFVPAV